MAKKSRTKNFRNTKSKPPKANTPPQLKKSKSKLPKTPIDIKREQYYASKYG